MERRPSTRRPHRLDGSLSPPSPRPPSASPSEKAENLSQGSQEGQQGRVTEVPRTREAFFLPKR